MDFMIKDEKSFDKYMTIWGKVSNEIKTNFNIELIYNKFYQKFKKRFNTEKSFQCLYTLVILIDSIYRKNENYYPKVFLDIDFIVVILMKNVIIKEL